MKKLSLVELFDKFDETSRPEYNIATGAMSNLEVPEIYTNFIPENKLILDKMHEVIAGKIFSIKKSYKIQPNLPKEPVQFILNCIETGDFFKISEIKENPTFSNWYEDRTTFHPAFQYIYELSLEYSKDSSNSQIANLNNVITALATCFLAE